MDARKAAAVALAAIAALCVVAAPSEGSDAAEGLTYIEADTSWYGSGEYVVDSPNDLVGLAEIVNSEVDDFNGKTVTLGADIDMTGVLWTPIGHYYYRSYEDLNYAYFDGIFDGAGYTISNLTITGDAYAEAFGLFGNTYGMTVRDLNMTGVVIDMSTGHGKYVGAIIGNANLLVDGDIEVAGCSVEISEYRAYASAVNISYVGGIIGYFYGGNLKVSDCTAVVDDWTVQISDGENSHVGGIVGHVHSNSGYSISGCASQLDLSLSYAGEQCSAYVGGIIGYSVADLDPETSSITGCHVEATVLSLSPEFCYVV